RRFEHARYMGWPGRLRATVPASACGGASRTRPEIAGALHSPNGISIGSPGAGLRWPLHSARHSSSLLRVSPPDGYTLTGAAVSVSVDVPVPVVPHRPRQNRQQGDVLHSVAVDEQCWMLVERRAEAVFEERRLDIRERLRLLRLALCLEECVQAGINCVVGVTAVVVLRPLTVIRIVLGHRCCERLPCEQCGVVCPVSQARPPVVVSVIDDLESGGLGTLAHQLE